MGRDGQRKWEKGNEGGRRWEKVGEGGGRAEKRREAHVEEAEVDARALGHDHHVEGRDGRRVQQPVPVCAHAMHTPRT